MWLLLIALKSSRRQFESFLYSSSCLCGFSLWLLQWRHFFEVNATLLLQPLQILHSKQLWWSSPLFFIECRKQSLQRHMQCCAFLGCEIGLEGKKWSCLWEHVNNGCCIFIVVSIFSSDPTCEQTFSIKERKISGSYTQTIKQRQSTFLQKSYIKFGSIIDVKLDSCLEMLSDIQHLLCLPFILFVKYVHRSMSYPFVSVGFSKVCVNLSNHLSLCWTHCIANLISSVLAEYNEAHGLGRWQNNTNASSKENHCLRGLVYNGDRHNKDRLN